MSFPFKSYDFDVIYTTVAEALKVKHPQNENENMTDWYRRLLYELMSYVHTQFEPEEIEEVIPPKNKNNKRKKKKNENQEELEEIVEDTIPPLASESIERSLEIIYQDSNFAIYLLSWFLPILVNLTDSFQINLTIDNSETPAEDVSIHHINILLENGIYKATLCINGVKLNSLTYDQYMMYSADPFFNTFLKATNFFQYGDSFHSYHSVIGINAIECDCHEPQKWSFRLCRFLWEIKNMLTPLYIDNIGFVTNLEPAEPIVLKKEKESKKLGKRKRFNEQKYLSSETITQDAMTAQIIRTLIISTFRTFYDYDPLTINEDLFGYLFLKKPLKY
jgi:hypothetical protein